VRRRAAAAARADLARALSVLDRRGFLRLAGGAAAAGLLPAGCGDTPPDLAPPADVTPRVLTPRTWATFQAAALRVVGPAGRERIHAAGVPLARRADERLAGLPALAGLVQQALLALEFGVWPLVGKLRPFTALDDAGRDAVLAGLMTARWDLSRALFQGVRSLTWLAWYADPESHALLRYPGPFGGAGVSVADAMTYDVESPAGAGPGARP
jgi:hypothetical protein